MDAALEQLEQSDGGVHADGDIAAGDMKASRDLLVREPVAETQLDDLAVGSGEQTDRSLEQNKQLSFLGKSFRTSEGGARAVVVEDFPETPLQTRGNTDFARRL